MLVPFLVLHTGSQSGHLKSQIPSCQFLLLKVFEWISLSLRKKTQMCYHSQEARPSPWVPLPPAPVLHSASLTVPGTWQDVVFHLLSICTCSSRYCSPHGWLLRSLRCLPRYGFLIGAFPYSSPSLLSIRWLWFTSPESSIILFTYVCSYCPPPSLRPWHVGRDHLCCFEYYILNGLYHLRYIGWLKNGLNTLKSERINEKSEPWVIFFLP